MWILNIMLRKLIIRNLDCLLRIPTHAEMFGLFHLFTLFLEEFDYTAREQNVLHTTEWK